MSDALNYELEQLNSRVKAIQEETKSRFDNFEAKVMGEFSKFKEFHSRLESISDLDAVETRHVIAPAAEDESTEHRDEKTELADPQVQLEKFLSFQDKLKIERMVQTEKRRSQQIKQLQTYKNLY